MCRVFRLFIFFNRVLKVIPCLFGHFVDRLIAFPTGYQFRLPALVCSGQYPLITQLKCKCGFSACLCVTRCASHWINTLVPNVFPPPAWWNSTGHEIGLGLTLNTNYKLLESPAWQHSIKAVIPIYGEQRLPAVPSETQINYTVPWNARGLKFHRNKSMADEWRLVI